MGQNCESAKHETIRQASFDFNIIKMQRSKSHKPLSACTHTLPDAMAMYLPVQSEKEVKGVMGILLEERRPVDEFEYGLLIAMLNETGVKLQDPFVAEESKTS